MVLSKLILRMVKKNFKSFEKRCQNLVTVTVTGQKRKIYCNLIKIFFSLINLKKNVKKSYNYSSYTDHEKLNTLSRSRSWWWTITVTITVTVMDDHGHGDGRSRSRWWTVETVWNGSERSGTKWKYWSRSRHGTVTFSVKNERFTVWYI